MASRRNASAPGIETKHHLAQADRVPSASLLRSYLHGAHFPKNPYGNSAESNLLLGSTKSQATAPPRHKAAATKNGAFHPSREAIQGASEAVVIPPNWFPIFMKPETAPEERPPMSAVTDQKELCER